MAPQNISIGVRGHVRSELQIGSTLWTFFVSLRNFFGDSRFVGPFYFQFELYATIEKFS